MSDQHTNNYVMNTDKAAMLLIDVQEKLFRVMDQQESLAENISILIQGMQILQVPVIWMEQVPEKLGPTILQLAQLLKPQQPLSKTTFSCCGNQNFIKVLTATDRVQLILAGIESHICVYQTACDLLARGFRVAVPVECVSSRTAGNKQIGLDRIKTCGGIITSTETILFELLKEVGGAGFKAISKLVK